jgi:ADP-heptose:LPS heptosyltransferase
MKPEKVLPEVTNKVLVRSTNWVGDTVTMLPFLVALRKAFLDEQITVLADRWVSLILEAIRQWIEACMSLSLVACRSLR